MMDNITLSQDDITDAFISSFNSLMDLSTGVFSSSATFLSSSSPRFEAYEQDLVMTKK